jgi:hypothetical protein
LALEAAFPEAVLDALSGIRLPGDAFVEDAHEKARRTQRLTT